MTHLSKAFKASFLTALFCITSAQFVTCAHAEEIIGRGTVIDGDTLDIHGEKIRLDGIDAPESDQLCTLNKKKYRCGQKAAFALDTTIDGRTIRCESKGKDKYARTLAACFVDNTNLNSWMVRNGWAVAYVQFSKKYVPDEKIARDKKVGVWVGTFENPWDFRKGPTEEEQVASKGCLIKGNINSVGKRLYHLPGSSAYGKTKIDTANGERWFCSEKQAHDAGWAKANP